MTLPKRPFSFFTCCDGAVCLCSDRMNEMGLAPADKMVYFGQLLGMWDQISFPLGKLHAQTHTMFGETPLKPPPAVVNLKIMKLQ